ncbi:MAG TPA: hypothetical protein DEA55_03220 [Rhodospirillaceae bacterium]|nr:hypothetical protein [Rhodospirillaceae bacterium]
MKERKSKSQGSNSVRRLILFYITGRYDRKRALAWQVPRQAKLTPHIALLYRTRRARIKRASAGSKALQVDPATCLRPFHSGMRVLCSRKINLLTEFGP